MSLMVPSSYVLFQREAPVSTENFYSVASSIDDRDLSIGVMSDNAPKDLISQQKRVATVWESICAFFSTVWSRISNWERVTHTRENHCNSLHIPYPSPKFHGNEEARKCYKAMRDFTDPGYQLSSSATSAWIEVLQKGLEEGKYRYQPDEVLFINDHNEPSAKSYSKLSDMKTLIGLQGNPASLKLISMDLLLPRAFGNKHIVTITVDKEKREIRYYDSQARPIDSPDNVIGEGDTSYTVLDVVNLLKWQFFKQGPGELPVKVRYNTVRHQDDKHNCGVHVSITKEQELQGISYASILLDPDGRHKDIDDKALSMAARIKKEIWDVTPEIQIDGVITKSVDDIDRDLRARDLEGGDWVGLDDDDFSPASSTVSDVSTTTSPYSEEDGWVEILL